jgi:epoxyqueuosine reductase
VNDVDRGLRALLLDEGVVAAGASVVSPMHFDASQARLRLAAGEASGAHFTFRNPERASSLLNTYPWCHSYVSIAVPYETRRPDNVGTHAVAPTEPDVADLETRARVRAMAPEGEPVAVSLAEKPPDEVMVAAYAQDRSYERLRGILGSATAYLRSQHVRAVAVYDSNHAFDKGLARRGGVGIIGRHSLVIVPKVGARVVLGAIVTDRAVDVEIGPTFRVDPCRGCRRCIDACPTNAIVFPGTLVAERCIATILQKESWSEDDRRSVGARVYGCDTCIDACPIGWRHRSSAGASTPSLVRWLTQDDTSLLAEVGHWYVPRRDPFYVRRNVANALRNRGLVTESERRALGRLCLSPDPRARREALRTLLALRWRRS